MATLAAPVRDLPGLLHRRPHRVVFGARSSRRQEPCFSRNPLRLYRPEEDAIRESRPAVELGPESTDAVNRVRRACDLALVYARNGRDRPRRHAHWTPPADPWRDPASPSD